MLVFTKVSVITAAAAATAHFENSVAERDHSLRKAAYVLGTDATHGYPCIDVFWISVT